MRNDHQGTVDRGSHPLVRDTTFGFIDHTIDTEKLYHPVLIANEGENTMKRAIVEELRRSESFTFSVAFITTDALAALKQALLSFHGRGTIVTSTYLGFNEPAVFRELLTLEGIDVRIHSDGGRGFHAKGYVFNQRQSVTAIVGSSNLTVSALQRNREWNLRFSAMPGGDIVTQLRTAVDAQYANSVPLTEEWIETYATSYVPPQPRTGTVTPVAQPAAVDDQSQRVVPNLMQSEALAEIASLRAAGEKRAVVVSATGTGKTILAALDVRVAAPKKMLFLVHREQILDRAMEEFKRVLQVDDDRFGKYVGSVRQLDRQFVFATVQSLSRIDTIAGIDPDHFDYILIDEVHRAGAESYRRVIDHFSPKFLLGVTATPERTDEFNVYELFRYNVAYEIRLQRALEEGMLSPFHYFGVTDLTVDGAVIDDKSQFSKLVSPQRVDHIASTLRKYGHIGVPVHGLIFCSRNEEARELARILNGRVVDREPLRVVALSGADSVETRNQRVDDLAEGRIDYIITVDVFNEGIDIPSVNQVVMLRRTRSSIVFTQQLGRGLRKAARKDHLRVIDFIGNYDSNFLIPIALFGNTSLNKDSIRRDMIRTGGAGALAGKSSVSFDEIAASRIFESLATARLDSMKFIKQTVQEMRNRVGSAPRLLDFARFDVADPVVLACKKGEYWSLLSTLKMVDSAPSPAQRSALTFLSGELLNGKRPHELLVLRDLMSRTGGLSHDDVVRLFTGEDVAADAATVESVGRVITFDFYGLQKREKYGRPIVVVEDGVWRLDTEFEAELRGSIEFWQHVEDVVSTGLFLARHRYNYTAELLVGERYSRRDVCRLLNWQSSQEATMYGYKVDTFTNTCPIFITYHKHDDVEESIAYEDEFLSESAIHWFTRSRRTLKSEEVRRIVSNDPDLHIFAKKDDAEGTDFYYLGRASSSDAKQTTMPSGGSELDVVTMTLALDTPIEAGMYAYLRTDPSNEDLAAV